MKDIFLEKIEDARPVQKTSAREEMFQKIMTEVQPVIQKTTVIKSPYTAWLQKPSKVAVAGFLAFCFVISAGGAAAVAEAAKPGDLLFPIDQATESIRLLLTKKEKKAALRLQFLEERQHELSAIVGEEIAQIETIDNMLPAPVTERGRGRITRALEVFLEQAEQLPAATTIERRTAVKAIFDDVRLREGGIDVRVRHGIDRLELRTDEERLRIRSSEVLDKRYRDEGGNRGVDGASTPVEQIEASVEDDSGHYEGDNSDDNNTGTANVE